MRRREVWGRRRESDQPGGDGQHNKGMSALPNDRIQMDLILALLPCRKQSLANARLPPVQRRVARQPGPAVGADGAAAGRGNDVEVVQQQRQPQDRFCVKHKAEEQPAGGACRGGLCKRGREVGCRCGYSTPSPAAFCASKKQTATLQQ